MMKKIIFVLGLLCLLSCDENRVYKSYAGKFDSYRWDKINKLTFEANVEDVEPEHDLILHVSHIFGYQFRNLKLKISITEPSGEVAIHHTNIKVIDKQKNYISECAGDLCDIYTKILENHKFQQVGVYKVEVSHEMQLDVLPNMIDVGIEIRKVESID